jgi:hypothetical protein
MQQSRSREDLWPLLTSHIGRTMRPKVFLRSFVVVARPSEEVEAELEAGTEKWLPDMAKEANGDGERLLSELGLRVGKRRIGKQIQVEIGASRAGAGLKVMPIRWHAATDVGLFPTLEGELEVAALGKTRTQLGLSANYTPPLGLLGKIADRALFHRVAEVTVKDFLERIVKRLEQNA